MSNLEPQVWGNPEELDAHAARCLRGGLFNEAIDLLRFALEGRPDDPHLTEHLGIALEGAGLTDEAQHILESLLAREPEFFVARLYLARIALRRQSVNDAYRLAHTAIRQAQRRGHWRNVATTAPWLMEAVQHLMNFMRHHRAERYNSRLKPLVDQYGQTAIKRLQDFISSYVGLDRQVPPDSRQRPRKQYFPGLPTAPWTDTALLPWTQTLEANIEVIRGEVLALLQSGHEFPPFLNFTSPDQIPKHLGTSGAPPEWNAHFFYRHGQRQDRNCEVCPRTTAILEQLPLVELEGFSPEICFSVLTPGTHIKLHHGDANTRHVVHLPLIVPADCTLRVGGEARSWQEGKVLAFDDTFEHEAWNYSDKLRVVLLLDCWNPHLTAAERDGLQMLSQEMQAEVRAIASWL